MFCLVCRAPVPADDLTCPTCRDFGSGWRAYPGDKKPLRWTATDSKRLLELAWFEAAAQRLRVALPAHPDAVSGPWGQFMLALDAYLRNDFAAALTTADLAACGGPVAGFDGLHDQAVRLREAAKQALGDVKLRRTYRVAVEYELPPLPKGVDFKDKPWTFYLEAIRAARMRDGHKCHLFVYKGICAARGTAGHPAVWFLKSLGKSVTNSRLKNRKFAADFDPQDSETAGHVFNELGLIKPSQTALKSPAWINAAKALVAFDRQAWHAAHRHMQVAWSLPGPERDHLDAVLGRMMNRLPLRVSSSTYSTRKQGMPQLQGLGVSGSAPRRSS